MTSNYDFNDLLLIHSRALQQMKLRLKGAQKGHSLLKKKADALTLRFRAILRKIIEVRYKNSMIVIVDETRPHQTLVPDP